MIFNEHKYKELAENIEQEYITLCGKQPCGECRYAFKSHCKTLFILDYLDKKKEEEKTLIYQMKIYYGAKLNNKVIYSTEITLEDCRRFPNKIDEKIYKEQLKQFIIKDGFAKPEDFTYGFLTKAEYENRITKNKEKTISFKLSKKNI